MLFVAEAAIQELSLIAGKQLACLLWVKQASVCNDHLGNQMVSQEWEVLEVSFKTFPIIGPNCGWTVTLIEATTIN